MHYKISIIQYFSAISLFLDTVEINIFFVDLPEAFNWHFRKISNLNFSQILPNVCQKFNDPFLCYLTQVLVSSICFSVYLDANSSNNFQLPFQVDKFHKDQQSMSMNNGTSATPVVEVQAVSQWGNCQTKHLRHVQHQGGGGEGGGGNGPSWLTPLMNWVFIIANRKCRPLLRSSLCTFEIIQSDWHSLLSWRMQL